MLARLGPYQPVRKFLLLKDKCFFFGCFLEGNSVALVWNNVRTQSEIIQL